MRKFLLCGGFYGSEQALQHLRQLVQEHRPDCILVVGGIMPKSDESDEKTRFGYLERFFKTLGDLNVHAAVIPGSDDVPLHLFLGLAVNTEVDFPHVHVVHGTVDEEKDVAICGVGGNFSQAEDVRSPSLVYAKNTAEYLLRGLLRAEQSRKVMLLGQAPPGPLGGEQGNAVVGDLIDSFHPDLCAVFGPTDHRGFQRIAHTFVVNPGWLRDGSAALVDWNKHVDEQVQLLDVTTGQPA